MRLSAFHQRLVSGILPVCSHYGLVLAGEYAMKAHGLTDRPCEDLALVAAADVPLREAAAAVAAACRAAGFAVTAAEADSRTGRLRVTEPETGRTCTLDLAREALQWPPSTCGDIAVLSLEDAAGLKVRAFHGYGMARDLIDVEAVGDLYSYRELERFARLHDEEFSLPELVMRLEFADHIADADFAAHGVDEERIRRIRRFAHAWAEDIKLRRRDDGDLDEADFDVPAID